MDNFPIAFIIYKISHDFACNVRLCVLIKLEMFYWDSIMCICIGCLSFGLGKQGSNLQILL